MSVPVGEHICPTCSTRHVIAIVVELHPDALAPVIRRLDRIEKAVGATRNELENDMSEIDDKLDALDAGQTAIETSLAVLTADEERELADLAALQNAGGTLTAEQAARFDDLLARQAAAQAQIDADTAAIDAADPAPAAPPADGGDTGAPAGDTGEAPTA